MPLLAYYDTNQWGVGPAIDKIAPYKGTVSGEREHQKPKYNFGPPSIKNPILVLDDDIITKNGYGLVKGFYEVDVSSDNNFLLLIQSGKTKAKIPIISWQRIKDLPQNKIEYKKISPKKQAKIEEKERKEKAKKTKKYQKGQNPDDYIYSKVELKFDRETQSYIIIWEYQNSRAIGAFKI